jgi:hypothetical protein
MRPEWKQTPEDVEESSTHQAAAKGQDAAMETGESREAPPSDAALDMQRVQASMQGYREQQEAELAEDLERYESQHGPTDIDPPGDSLSDAEPGLHGMPLSDDAISEILRIQGLPAAERPQAVADFHNTAAGQKAAHDSGGLLPAGKGVFYLGAGGNRYDIPYQDEE